ncbi:CIC11C00000003405 [Sungouiella intermedia]|uniref:CIC11C00000003405 n=1 Tax=Sungouiella intermedia TaxID=45354 RepID=A0A1L0DFF7_9ASCO|nr:CIC11C00000003405 [[Candida] intermedia]
MPKRLAKKPTSGLSNQGNTSGNTICSESTEANNQGIIAYLISLLTPSMLESPIRSQSSSSGASQVSDYEEERLKNKKHIETLRKSLQNPNLSPSVRTMLENGLRDFEKIERDYENMLPKYTDLQPPPYRE